MPFRSNNPITRDELLSRFFPQFHPVTTFNSGLSGGVFIEHQGQRFVVRQPHDPDAPRFAFLRQYRALSQLPACIAPKPHLYLRDWMVVDYLPGEVKRICRIPTNWQACCTFSTSTTAFWLANNAVAVTGTVLAAKRSGAATVGWLRRLKTSAQSAGTTAFTLNPLHMDVHAGNLVHSASGLNRLGVCRRW